MFLRISDDVHDRFKELYSRAGDEPERARLKAALERAMHVAWDRLGPASDYEVSIGDHRRTLRRGEIELQDLEEALR